MQNFPQENMHLNFCLKNGQRYESALNQGIFVIVSNSPTTLSTEFVDSSVLDLFAQ